MLTPQRHFCRANENQLRIPPFLTLTIVIVREESSVRSLNTLAMSLVVSPRCPYGGPTQSTCDPPGARRTSSSAWSLALYAYNITWLAYVAYVSTCIGGACPDRDLS